MQAHDWKNEKSIKKVLLEKSMHYLKYVKNIFSFSFSKIINIFKKRSFIKSIWNLKVFILSKKERKIHTFDRFRLIIALLQGNRQSVLRESVYADYILEWISF